MDTVAPAAVLDLQARYDGDVIEVTWAAGSLNLSQIDAQLVEDHLLKLVAALVRA